MFSSWERRLGQGILDSTSPAASASATTVVAADLRSRDPFSPLPASPPWLAPSSAMRRLLGRGPQPPRGSSCTVASSLLSSSSRVQRTESQTEPSARPWPFPALPFDGQSSEIALYGGGSLVGCRRRPGVALRRSRCFCCCRYGVLHSQRPNRAAERLESMPCSRFRTRLLRLSSDPLRTLPSDCHRRGSSSWPHHHSQHHPHRVLHQRWPSKPRPLVHPHHHRIQSSPRPHTLLRDYPLDRASGSSSPSPFCSGCTHLRTATSLLPSGALTFHP